MINREKNKKTKQNKKKKNKKQKNKIFALATENGPEYFTPTFSNMHNFCSRLSI